MLVTQMNDMVRSGELRTGCVVQLMDFMISNVRDRQVAIVLSINILAVPPSSAGAGGGEPLPALEKMMVSLGERLPATWGKASRLGFLRGIKGIVSSAWMRGNAQARQALVEKNQPKVMIKMRST